MLKNQNQHLFVLSIQKNTVNFSDFFDLKVKSVLTIAEKYIIINHYINL